MVDINLFKEGEEEKEWDPIPQKEESPSDGLDDFKFEDETKTPALDDKSILDEGFETVEEHPEKPNEEDYDSGPDDQKKNTNVWTWAVLGVVVIAAISYLYLFQPKKPEVPKTVVPSNLRPVTQRDTTAIKPDSPQTGLPIGGEAVRTASVPAAAGNRLAVYAVLTKAVIENLGQQGQFGTVLLNEDRFSVEYVSNTPGVSDAMAYRIKTLMGASEVTASPEERHKTAGAIHYWGVISGAIPKTVPGTVAVQSKHYATTDLFVDALKNLIKENGLAERGVTRSGQDEKATVQVRVEGSRAGIVQLLDALKRSPNNYSLDKLVGVPVDIADFEATKMKLVLEFSVLG